MSTEDRQVDTERVEILAGLAELVDASILLDDGSIELTYFWPDEKIQVTLRPVSSKFVKNFGIELKTGEVPLVATVTGPSALLSTPDDQVTFVQAAIRIGVAVPCVAVVHVTDTPPVEVEDRVEELKTADMTFNVMRAVLSIPPHIHAESGTSH